MVDYAADVSVGLQNIHGFEFKTKLILDGEGNHFPLVLYMEKPALHGQNANKLMLIACKTAPPQVRYALHPGAFRPRKTTSGWVHDPRRHTDMWWP